MGATLNVNVEGDVAIVTSPRGTCSWEVYNWRIEVGRSGRLRNWVKRLVGYVEKNGRMVKFAVELGFAALEEIKAVIDSLPGFWSGAVAMAERWAAGKRVLGRVLNV